MDELKRLKKDWQENLKFPKLSKDEIYKLLHKKSSSIVKRIFVFSLIEFGFWSLLGDIDFFYKRQVEQLLCQSFLQRHRPRPI